MNPDLDDARRRYEHALAPEDRERHPFYAELCDRLGDDELGLTLLGEVRATQRNPMLILAALHWHALRGHEILGPLYERVRRGEPADVKVDVATVLTVLHNNPALVRGELWRSTQTNEPGRSAVLQALVSELAQDRRAINVIEVGSSAGINLHFERFRVRAFDDHDALTLVCRDLGGVIERTLPSIARRIGIDPNPLDLANRDDRLWLKACLWPEDRRRHERFDAVVAAWPTWEPVEVLCGSVRERFDEALTLTKDSFTIVINTWVLFYLSEEERAWFLTRAHDAARAGRCAAISVESPLVEIAGIDATKRPEQRGASRIVVAREFDAPELWGWCHPHGRWLEKVRS